MTTDSVPLRDLLLAARRCPDEPQYKSEHMVADDLTVAQFADIVSNLIHDMAARHNVSPGFVLEAVKHMHDSWRPYGQCENVRFVTFNRKKPT